MAESESQPEEFDSLLANAKSSVDTLQHQNELGLSEINWSLFGDKPSLSQILPVPLR